MLRSFYIAAFLLMSPLCQGQNLTLEQLVPGANQARHTIESGEMRVIITVDHAAEKSPEEIQAWLKEEKAKILRTLSRPEQAVEREYDLAQLPFAAKWFDERWEIEASNIAFRVLSHGSMYPEHLQYKMSLIDRRGLDMYSDEGRFSYGGYYRFLTYDDQIQAYEYVFPNPSIMFANSNRYAGYLYFELFGRSLTHVPLDAKLLGKETIADADCYILEFQPGKVAPFTNLVRVWIDPQKDFCVRKEYREQQARKEDGHLDEHPRIWEINYEDFQKHGDIWYPMVARSAVKLGENIEARRTILVKEAQLNLDFPSEFFHVLPRGYVNQGLDVIEADDGIPGLSRITESQGPTPAAVEPDLLTCGPDSLLRVCQLLKVDTDFDELSRLTNYNPKAGTNMLGLLRAAKFKNLNPKGIRADIKALKKIPLPAIGYLKGNHFLVFEQAVSDGVLVFDPAKKYDHYLSSKELSQIWGGELLIFDYNLDQVKPLPSQACVVVEESLHNFGEVLAGSKIKHNFKLKNTGNDVLNILNVEVPCACTATVLSKYEIPPGEFGVIEAILTVPSDISQVEQSFYVYTSDPAQNRIPFTFKGTAFLPISTFPDHVFFGKVEPKRTLKKNLTVHRSKGKDIKITGVRVNSPDLTAQIVSNEESEITRIEVAMLKLMQVGQFIHRLSIDYSYEGEKATHSVTVRGEVLGVFDVYPKKLFFGLVNREKSVTKTTTISPVNSQPFNITEVLSGSKYISTKIMPQADEIGYHMLVAVSRNAPSGELSGEIMVKTDSATQPTIRVPFAGIISNKN